LKIVDASQIKKKLRYCLYYSMVKRIKKYVYVQHISSKSTRLTKRNTKYI
jgi:hypothetical protein